MHLTYGEVFDMGRPDFWPPSAAIWRESTVDVDRGVDKHISFLIQVDFVPVLHLVNISLLFHIGITLREQCKISNSF